MLNELSCKPGAYIEIVPQGLLCTLQYNENGILQKIIKGFNYTNYKDADVLDSSLVIDMKKAQIVPARIQFKKGTTWILGVLYTKKQFKSEGTLPDCIEDELLKDLPSNLSDYTFYAGHMKNDSYEFVGASVIATRMSTFEFNVLPGYIVYDTIGELPIKQIMDEKKSPFLFPMISGAMIYENASNWRYVPTGLSQRVVTATENYQDEHGYIHTIITSGKESIDKSYCDVVQYDVQPKTLIITDGDEILYSKKMNSLFRTKLSRSTICPVCGKALTVPIKGFAVCQDPHCLSKLYPTLRHFLQVLLLPEMSFDEFKEHVSNKYITCLIDVLVLDKYKDIIITCTLSNLLFAMVPFELCRGADFFQEFTNTLGSLEAFDYYMQNPDTIVTDLKLNPRYARNFAEWLKDPVNSLELETLLNSDQVEIKSVTKKFDGSPIFRNKVICLTGKFRRGTLEDVMSILQSYSAKIVTKFDNTVDCVIVGKFENEDKQITELAQSYNIPIYGEDSFFSSYGIDNDVISHTE